MKFTYNNNVLPWYTLAIVVGLSMVRTAALAQGSTPFPEQECVNALPVCSQIIVQPTGYPAIQNPVRLPAVGIVEFPVWYALEAATTGTFGFTITPNDVNDDYDWAVYDVTERGCEAVSQVRPLSFNLSGRRGVTGANSMGALNEIGSGSNANPLNALIQVRTGRRYILLVFFTPRRNPNGTNSGFTLDFSPSSPRVIGQSPPLTFAAAVPFSGTCGIRAIRVTFSEPVACATVQPRDLVLQGLQIRGFSDVRSNLFGALTPTSRGFDRTFTFNLGAPVTEGGRYTLAFAGPISTVCGTFNRGDTTLALEVDPPRVEISGGRFFCRTVPTTLSVPNEFESYRWTNAVGTIVSEKASVAVSEAGVYSVEVNSAGCKASSSATVRLRENLSIQIFGATTFCDDDCAYNAAEEGFELYEWLDSTNTIIARQRDICIKNPGVYRVRANVNGCVAISPPYSIRKFSAPTLQPRITRRGNVLSVINPQPDSLRIEWRKVIGGGRFDFVRFTSDSLFVPPDTGRYTVAFVNAAECWTTAPPLTFQPIRASASFRVGSVSAAQNTLVGIPILLTSAQNLAGIGVDSFRVSLRSNARLLFPEDARVRRYTVENNERITQIVLPTQAVRGDTLGIVTFRAMLGNTTSTILSLQELNTLPPNLGLRMSASNGLFTLIGIATEGSVRLVGRRGTRLALSVQPNPVVGRTSLVVSVNPDAPGASQEARIFLTDILGQHRRVVFDGMLPNGEHTFSVDCHNLPTGAYMLMVQTADERTSTPLTILR
jgi:hypothetical protein